MPSVLLLLFTLSTLGVHVGSAHWSKALRPRQMQWARNPDSPASTAASVRIHGVQSTKVQSRRVGFAGRYRGALLRRLFSCFIFVLVPGLALQTMLLDSVQSRTRRPRDNMRACGSWQCCMYHTPIRPAIYCCRDSMRPRTKFPVLQLQQLQQLQLSQQASYYDLHCSSHAMMTSMDTGTHRGLTKIASRKVVESMPVLASSLGFPVEVEVGGRA
ncbi:unnamed protein product [Mortierella alpina]